MSARARCFGLLLSMGLCAPAGAGEAIPWIRDQAGSFSQAGEKRCVVMILFTGSSCGPKALPGEISRGGDTKDFIDKCERMEQEVLSSPDVVAAASRFVPLMVDQSLVPKKGEGSLWHVHQVGTIPTLLFADPWGNEIIRLVGFVPKDRFLGILKALAVDLSGAETAGRLLREDSQNASALVALAAFYNGKGLLPVSDTLYARALASPGLQDGAERRQVAIARGTTLLRLNRASDAAKLFEKTFGENKDGPMSDALLFGWMMAEAQGGQTKQARQVFGELEKRFPASDYTTKARQNLAAAKP